jgi:predicted RNA-binding protein with PIN domain
VSNAITKHLLVDGSNIMHAWPELRSLMPRDRDAARSRLSQSMAALHDAGHLRVTIVFDGRGLEMTVERPSGHATFSHIHTPTGTTADEVIVQLVRKSAEPCHCVVATDDRGERAAVEALGAAILSAADLAAWAGRASLRHSSQIKTNRAQNERKWRNP